MFYPISVGQQYSNGFPVINQEQLPAVMVRSLPEAVDASNARQKRVYIPDSSTQRYLKPLDPDSQELLSSDVIDLAYFRSIFLFPLDYLRRTLIAAYQWAQKLLSPEDRPSPRVDLYV